MEKWSKNPLSSIFILSTLLTEVILSNTAVWAAIKCAPVSQKTVYAVAKYHRRFFMGCSEIYASDSELVCTRRASAECLLWDQSRNDITETCSCFAFWKDFVWGDSIELVLLGMWIVNKTKTSVVCGRGSGPKALGPSSLKRIPVLSINGAVFTPVWIHSGWTRPVNWPGQTLLSVPLPVYLNSLFSFSFPLSILIFTPLHSLSPTFSLALTLPFFLSFSTFLFLFPSLFWCFCILSVSIFLSYIFFISQKATRRALEGI